MPDLACGDSSRFSSLLLAPAEGLHLDCGEQRHRAATIVGAVHGRAIQVVLLRGPCRGARTHVAHGAVLVDGVGLRALQHHVDRGPSRRGEETRSDAIVTRSYARSYTAVIDACDVRFS